MTPRRALLWLGLLGFLHLADDSLGWTRILFFCPLAVLAWDAVDFLRRVRDAPDEDPATARALPGPAERGPLRFLLRYAVSETLTLLHPRGFRQVLRQARGDALARLRTRGREPRPGEVRTKVDYTLPFAGEWTVARGGETPETSHSWDIVSQRFAFDFLVVDEGGRSHRGDGSRLDDYYAYGEPILAPADGEVVEVVDGVRDASRPGTGWVDWRTPHLAGNSVTIRHAEGEYSFLAHLMQGSVRVRPGQRVRRGEEVGRCGNSGHSTEPHLHFQLQDDADFFRAVGLPVRLRAADGDGG